MVIDNLLDNFQIEQDIYKLNPQLSILFTIPSKDLWCYLLLNHPTKSIFSNLTKTEALDAIKQSYHPDFVEDISITAQVQSLLLSKTKKMLKAWEQKYEERIEFINSLSYTPENIDILEKLMANTDKIHKQYITAVKASEDEQSVFGGAQESLSELGLI